MSSRFSFGWALLLALITTAVPAHAQEAGRVTGSAVEMETGRPLVGASVRVEGTSLAVTTDAQGRFTLPRVPSGNRTVTVSYLGRAAQSETVSVSAGGEARVAFRSPVLPVLIDGIEVLGTRLLAQSEALSRQKNASNIQNIVASDQMGRFPDASAPEAVQRIPGVSIARDQGEGRYIQIRGGSAANTQVSFNGVQIPSPEGEARQIALDAVPVDVLQSIEVSKALLPDMDADAIGGAVNLVTRKAPASRLFSLEAAGGFAPIRDDGSGSGALTFGDRTPDGRLGFLMGGSYSRRNFGSDDVEPSWDLGDDGLGDDVLEELEVRHYTLWRERMGVTGNLDYRLSETSSLNLTGVFSSMTDEEQRRNLVSVLEDDALEWRHKNRKESLRTYNLTLGGQHLSGGGIGLDYGLAWSRSLEDTPYDTEIMFVREDVSFAPNIRDPENVRSNPGAGALEGPFLFDSIEPASSDTRNTDRTASLNLTVPLGGSALSGRIRAGARVRDKNKVQDLTEQEFELDDGEIVLGRDVGVPNGLNLRYPGSYSLPSYMTDPLDVSGFVSRFSSRLDGETSVEAETNDYDLKERVLAGYLMAELNATPSLLLVPGVRFEHTRFESDGFAFDSESEELTPMSSERSYGNLFPMLHARLELDARTNLRAAFTTTIARPNFFDLVPYRVQDDEDLVLGNPALEPTLSRAFDLLFERYDQRIGVMSAGAFYKRLQNPIFLFTEDNTLGGETEQPRNGESGWIRGLEVALQRSLFGGVGLYANYTFTDSEAELPSGRAVRLQGQSDHVFNAALGFDRGPFTSQLSANFHNDYVSEYADDAAEDVFVDRHLQLDASATYRMGRSTLFLEVVNLTNEPLVAYEGTPERPIQMEYYQMWGRLGVRVNW